MHSNCIVRPSCEIAGTTTALAGAVEEEAEMPPLMFGVEDATGTAEFPKMSNGLTGADEGCTGAVDAAGMEVEVPPKISNGFAGAVPLVVGGAAPKGS